MRAYGSVSPRFWTGDTGRALRGFPEAQVVALYLMTCPGSHMIGMYYLAIPTLCHETGLSPQGASKGLARVCEAHFAEYDSAEEVVWVPEMANFQIGAKLDPRDNRIQGVERELENFRKSRFFNAFLLKYGAAYNLKTQPLARRSTDAPPEPLISPFIAPRKPGSGSGTGSGQEEVKCAEPENAPAPTPFLSYLSAEFPTARATQANEKAWCEAFPGVDLLAEAKNARRWELDNPKKIKTQKRRFLGNWFSTAQDRVGHRPGAAGNGLPVNARPISFREADQAAEIAQKQAGAASAVRAAQATRKLLADREAVYAKEREMQEEFRQLEKELEAKKAGGAT